MKTKTLFLSLTAALFFFLVQRSAAQGNLQFNQVINYTLTGLSPLNVTVPLGKVWKIEQVSTEYTNTPTVYLRNASNWVLATFYTSSGYQNNVPYWLNAGFTGNFILNNSATYHGSVSIIEFNVVP